MQVQIEINNPEKKIIEIGPIFEWSNMRTLLQDAIKIAKIENKICWLVIKNNYGENINYRCHSRIELDSCFGDLFIDRKIKPLLLELKSN